MKRKVCFKCNKRKGIDGFYKHPAMAHGVLGKCKECAKKDVKENRLKNSEYYRAYDKLRYKRDDKIINRQKKYLKTKEGKSAKKRSIKAYNDRYPTKKKAHIITRAAIRDGKLTKSPCKKCGNKKVEAHHTNYFKPLKIMWLCSKCHAEWHKKYEAKF